MKLAPIIDCVVKHQTINPVNSTPNDNFEYIDISSIDRDSKRITAVQTLKGSEAPSRARQLVKMNDIIVSTVRPNLNSVAKVPMKLNNAIASTGYCVLRANEDVLDSAYLFKWVKSKYFIRDMAKKATGANYPAVSDRIIKESKIPLPPLKTQKQIATVLDRANALIRTRQRSIEKLDELIQSLFLEMFGDPVTNPMNWEKQPLDKFGQIITGNTPSRKKPEYYEPKFIEWTKTNNIFDSNMYISVASEYLSELGKTQARVAREGALLVTCIAGSIKSIGISALTNREVSFNQQINAIQPNDFIDPIFLYLLFKLSKKFIQDHATSGMKRIITKGEFLKIQMIKPPIELQIEFSKQVQAIESQKVIHQKSLNSLQTLFDSLMQRAFNGELELNESAFSHLEESIAS